jgi:hypothetical protein
VGCGELLTHHTNSAATIGQVGFKNLSDSRVDLSIHSQRYLLCQPCGGGSLYTNQLQRLDGQCAALRLTRSLRRTFFVIMKREAVFSVLHCLAPSYDTFLAPWYPSRWFFHSCYTSVTNDPSMSNMTVTVVSKKRKCGPKTRSGCQTCK